MVKMTVKAFAKKLFGARYERLPRILLINLIVFWGLYAAGWRVQIGTSVRYLMVSVFTAGVMWQALSSKDMAAEMQHMLMLPFEGRAFVLSYIAVLGGYTVFTKTGMLLAVLLAVSVWRPGEVLGIIISIVHAVLMAPAVYFLKKYWYAGGLWAGITVLAILFWGNGPWLLPGLAINAILSLLVLGRAEGYDFYQRERKKSGTKRQGKGGSLWRYFFRYLRYHKNYLTNTAVMWCAAIVLPRFLGEIGGQSAAPAGFAILSLNTPICILLSCDPDLEQAVRFLPGQKKAFCIPYCLFIFLCNMTGDVIFLCSWQIQKGGVTAFMIAGAVFFALQSGILSVLLEWACPIRGWKIESDLWHHPRKYMVPVAMLLLAGILGICQELLPVLLILLAVEIAVLLFQNI